MVGVAECTLNGKRSGRCTFTRVVGEGPCLPLTTKMPAVTAFTLTYDRINEQGTFSEGDPLTGEVTLNLAKATKVESLSVKAKGDANVHWSDDDDSIKAHTRFFKLKEILIQETELSMGIHVYKFSFRIPIGSVPSSFKGAYGKIVYKLEVTLTRSWRMDRTIEQELNFASKAISGLSYLMTRQVGQIDKEMGAFSSGSVHMDATIESGVYSPGTTVAIAATVKNTSSKDMTPKFSLKQKIMYRARSHSKHDDNVICKAVGDVIAKKTERTVYCALTIPPDQTLSIQNCDIISVEYQLKVYLDISFASDPEIKFPVVIVPQHSTANLQPGGTLQPYPPVAFGGPSRSDFPPPSACFVPPPGQNAYGHPAAFGSGYGPGPVGPPAYPAYPPMPAQPAMFPGPPVDTGAAHYHPVPPNVSPYGLPAQYSSSTPVHHPPPAPYAPPAPMFNPTPSAPPLIDHSSSAQTFNLPSFGSEMNTDFLSQQNEEPPSYLSMFPPPTTDQTK